MNRNIELIRYRRFTEQLLLMELVNATSAYSSEENGEPSAGPTSYSTISQTLEQAQGPLRDLFEEVRAYLLALGDDVQEKTLKYYVAYKRLKNFACLEVHPTKGTIAAFVKVDPATMEIETGFMRDVSDIGHYGTGDLEVTIRSRADLERAKPLFQQSYESS
jgi:predicted transport protein